MVNNSRQINILEKVQQFTKTNERQLITLKNYH